MQQPKPERSEAHTIDHDSIRRAAKTALAALPVSGDMRRQCAKTLLAYFSRSGNTRVVAGLIRRARRTDLFEIVPAAAYPEDYLETVEQARKERETGYAPALQSRVADIAD